MIPLIISSAYNTSTNQVSIYWHSTNTNDLHKINITNCNHGEEVVLHQIPYCCEHHILARLPSDIAHNRLLVYTQNCNGSICSNNQYPNQIYLHHSEGKLFLKINLKMK